MPCNYAEYPPDWEERRARILKRAGNKCETCGVPNHEIINRPVYEDGDLVDMKSVYIILTIAHLDHDHENWDVKDERLKALCQQCHNRYDGPHRAAQRKKKIELNDAQLLLISNNNNEQDHLRPAQGQDQFCYKFDAERDLKRIPE